MAPETTTCTHPDIPVIFEDAHLLVIDKPHGVLSQEDHTGDPDVLTLCKQYLARNSSGNTPYLGLLHRLDRPVGGLMMLAKTPQAAKKVSKQIRDRLVQKTYHAVVQGSPPANGVLTHHLCKDRQANTVEVVKAGRRDGKEAILSFARIAQHGELALLSIHLQTGRPHQIRVQLSAEDFPVWGDYRYGRQQPDGRTMALRAVELRLNHPANRNELQFTLPRPAKEPWDQF